MAQYIVNTAVGDLTSGEVIEIDPSLFGDYIEAQYISPIDSHGNRLLPGQTLDESDDTGDTGEQVLDVEPVAE